MTVISYNITQPVRIAQLSKLYPLLTRKKKGEIPRKISLDIESPVGQGSSGPSIGHPSPGGKYFGHAGLGLQDHRRNNIGAWQAEKAIMPNSGI